MKILLTPLLLFIASCSEKPRLESENVQSPNRDWDTSFFAPVVGETLIYQQNHEYILPDQRRPIQSDQIEKVITLRKQTYLGPIEIDGQTFHQNAVSFDDQFREGILLSWNGEMLSLAGSFDQNAKPKLQPIFIPFAQIDMQVGTYWKWPNEMIRGSGSRVVGFGKVSVPAGTFEAFKISIKRGISSKIYVKEYWFAPRIGIVKEVNRRYSGGLLRTLTTIELIERVSPESDASSSS